MIVTIERRKTFVPEWRKNKKEATPVNVVYRYATTEERDKFVHWSSPTVESSLGSEAVSKVVRIIERKDMFLTLTEKVNNLTGRDKVTGKEFPVTSAREILENPGFNDLYDEIVGDMIQSTAVADLKNSE